MSKIVQPYISHSYFCLYDVSQTLMNFSLLNIEIKSLGQFSQITCERRH